MARRKLDKPIDISLRPSYDGALMAQEQVTGNTMKKRLFKAATKDENEKYTSEAIALDNRLQNLIRPLLMEYITAGYSLRDIQHVAVMSVTDCMLGKIIAEDFT